MSFLDTATHPELLSLPRPSLLPETDWHDQQRTQTTTTRTRAKRAVTVASSVRNVHVKKKVLENFSFYLNTFESKRDKKERR